MCSLSLLGPPSAWLTQSPVTIMTLFLELNNVEFHCGRAEDLVPGLVSRLSSQQLVAVLDPPRAGLRKWIPFGEVAPEEKKAILGSPPLGETSPSVLLPDSKVILAIRRAENIKRLLYVSCNPRAAMGNFVE